jgi:hypothetical protein
MICTKESQKIFAFKTNEFKPASVFSYKWFTIHIHHKQVTLGCGPLMKCGPGDKTNHYYNFPQLPFIRLFQLHLSKLSFFMDII